MNASPLELYLKLNLLLVAAFVLWLVTKQLAHLLRFEVSHMQQLKVARNVFMALLFAVPLVVVLKVLLPELVKGVVAAVSGTGIIPEFTFTAGVNDALNDGYQFGKLRLDPALSVLMLLIAGLLLQAGRLFMQITRLRNIMANATEWKSINGIQLLISSSITSPFSTRVLGSKQIVLPAQLLESPRNLRLAVKHELQHVRNGDLGWVILLEAVNVLCFWNPFAWLWHNEFDCLQEFACDEVLVNERRVNSQAYGNCLLDVAGVVTGQAMLASSNMVPKFSFWQNQSNQLKRRIHMLMKVSNKNNVGLKTLCYSVLIGLGLSGTTVIVFGAEEGSAIAAQVKPQPKTQVEPQPGAQAKSQPGVQAESQPGVQAKRQTRKDVKPLSRVPPKYPESALKNGLEGQVQVDFTVDETGSVQDAMAAKSCAGSHTDAITSCKEDDTFKEAALEAIKQWKYQPAEENGIAVEREHVQTWLKFQLKDDKDLVPLVKIPPQYPQRALARGIEGWVTLQFTVTETGSVTDAVVTNASPKGVFEEAALKAIQRWTYNPQVEGGRAIASKDIKTTMRFQFEYN